MAVMHVLTSRAKDEGSGVSSMLSIHAELSVICSTVGICFISDEGMHPPLGSEWMSVTLEEWKALTIFSLLCEYI